MALRLYDPKDITIIFGVAGVISEFSDGSFVTVEKSEEAFQLLIGVDGESARAKTNNQSGRITISLMQSSPSNDNLSIIHTADLELGTGVFPLFIKDLNGNSIYEATKAWITKFPQAVYGREAGPREWEFATDKLNVFEGGNEGF